MRCPRPFALELPLPPCLQQGGQRGRQRDRTGTGLRFRIVGVRVIVWPGLPDRDQAAVEVGLGPGQAGHLGAAQPCERGQRVQRIEPVAFDGVEELAGLLRGPHHHRAGPPGAAALAPAGDALGSPKDRLALRHAQLDAGRRVDLQRLAVIQRRAERRGDALDGGLAQRRSADPLVWQMRQYSAGGGEPAEHLGLVPVFGRPVELPHRLVRVEDVLLTQIGEPDMPERRDPVQADRFRVALIGPLLAGELLPFQPAQELDAERHLPVVGVGARLHVAERFHDRVLAFLLGAVRPDPRLPALAVRAGRCLDPVVPAAMALPGQARAFAAAVGTARHRVAARAISVRFQWDFPSCRCVTSGASPGLALCGAGRFFFVRLLRGWPRREHHFAACLAEIPGKPLQVAERTPPAT